ncbi:hypothetical protein P7M09_28085, partial [Vibrio parahaemolyticus]|nr:hypothetical protein [Vibrio parahaemolyticus]
MTFKASLLCLASALLLPSLAHAKSSCTIEDFQPIARAGGVVGILGELNRAGLLHNQSKTV